VSLEDAFLRDIAEHPDDDAPRLIYADWLEEHGDPSRAEFIRVQCEMAKATGNDPRWQTLYDRQAVLLKAHRERWLEPVRLILERPPSLLTALQRVMFREGTPAIPWHDHYNACFRRGFLGSLYLTASELLAHADVLFRVAPTLNRLGLDLESADDADALFDCPHLARLHELSLFDEVVGQPAVEQLVSCPHLGRLRHLFLSSPLLDAACVRALAGGPLLGRLTGLALCTRQFLGQSEWTQGTLGEDAARVLAECPAVGKLSALDLSFNRIGDQGTRALANSPYLAGLSWLLLNDDGISDAGAAAIAGSPHLASLEGLHLDVNAIADAGAGALAASPHLARLRALTLHGNPISEQGREALKARFGDRVKL
jgi:uncharacterized protein (TIGR02996 family)